MYRNQSGEFVCAYRGLKGFNVFLEVSSPWKRSRRPSIYFPAVQFRLVSRFLNSSHRDCHYFNLLLQLFRWDIQTTEDLLQMVNS